MKKKKNISQEDISVWNEFTKNPIGIFDKEALNKNISSKLNRFKFDLHGFTLDEANKKTRQIVINCAEKGIREILLITGKGIHSDNENNVYNSKDLSKLRFSVPAFLESDIELKNLIISVSEANKADGGEGALIIKLKQLQNKFR